MFMMVLGVIVFRRFIVTVVILWPIRSIVLMQGPASCCVKIHAPPCGDPMACSFLIVPVSAMAAVAMILHPFFLYGRLRGICVSRISAVRILLGSS